MYLSAVRNQNIFGYMRLADDRLSLIQWPGHFWGVWTLLMWSDMGGWLEENVEAQRCRRSWL